MGFFSRLRKRFDRTADVATSLRAKAASFAAAGDHKRAIIAYQEFVDRFPDDDLVPDILMEQGIAFVRLGEKKTGETLFGLVRVKFPGSTAAARAAQGAMELAGGGNVIRFPGRSENS